MKPMHRKLVISKMDAAGRQLETAIRLYFNGGDPVSIHTLGAAAHTLLRGLASAAIVPLELEDFPMAEGLKARFKAAIDECRDVAGNAPGGADDLFDFDPALAPFFIFDAISNYQALGGEIGTPFSAFRGWFCALHMDEFLFMEEDRAYLMKMKNRYAEDRATYYAEMMHAGRGR
jgi:hypothetical protein